MARGSLSARPAAARGGGASATAARAVAPPGSYGSGRAWRYASLAPTLVLRVDQVVLDELLDDWPELAHGVIAQLVARLRASAEQAGQAQ